MSSSSLTKGAPTAGWDAELLMLFYVHSDAFREMIDSVAANKTFDETKEYLKNSQSFTLLRSSC